VSRVRRRPLVVLSALLLFVTACGQDAVAPGSAGSTAPASALPGPPATTPPPPQATTAPSTTASTGPSSPGPSSTVPPTAASADSATRTGPAAQGDVDGDGEPDEIAYEGSEAVVTLSGGGVLRAGVEADIAPEEPVTAGVEDLDRDGRAEVFVKVGQGASTAFLLVLRHDGSRLAALQRDGTPLLLAYGGSATHGDGFTCTDAGSLLVRSASSDDGTTYALQTVTYRVRGDAVVETGRTSATGTGMDDPAVAAAYVVDCRSVGEGG